MGQREHLKWEEAQNGAFTMHRAVGEPYVIFGDGIRAWALGHGTPPTVRRIGLYRTVGIAKTMAEFDRAGILGPMGGTT